MSSQRHTEVPMFLFACACVFPRLQEADGIPSSSRPAPVVPVSSTPAHWFVLLLQEAEEKGNEQPGKEKFEDDFFDTMSSDATGGLALSTPCCSWAGVAMPVRMQLARGPPSLGACQCDAIISHATSGQ